MEAILMIRTVVIFALNAYWYLIIANVILSWVRPDPRNPIVRFIHSATDPLFNLARRAMPFLVAGAIDFSPIVVILLLQLLVQLVDKLFQQLAISAG